MASAEVLEAQIREGHAIANASSAISHAFDDERFYGHLHAYFDGTSDAVAGFPTMFRRARVLEQVLDHGLHARAAAKYDFYHPYNQVNQQSRIMHDSNARTVLDDICYARVEEDGRIVRDPGTELEKIFDEIGFGGEKRGIAWTITISELVEPALRGRVRLTRDEVLAAQQKRQVATDNVSSANLNDVVEPEVAASKPLPLRFEGHSAVIERMRQKASARRIRNRGK